MIMVQWLLSFNDFWTNVSPLWYKCIINYELHYSFRGVHEPDFMKSVWYIMSQKFFCLIHQFELFYFNGKIARRKYNFQTLILIVRARWRLKSPALWLFIQFSRSSMTTSKLRVTGLCEGNSPVIGECPAQRASNAENVSIWWRHHVYVHMDFNMWFS